MGLALVQFQKYWLLIMYFKAAVKVFVKLEHLVELLLAEDAMLLDAAISA